MRKMIVIRTWVAVLMAAAIGGSLCAQQVPQGLYTAAQAKRGEAVYQENCAMCHGPLLAGSKMAPALSGPGFSAKWEKQPLEDLFDYMRLFMPLHSPGGLTNERNAELLAFLLRSNGFPSGQTELPSVVGALHDIKFEAVKR